MEYRRFFRVKKAGHTHPKPLPAVRRAVGSGEFTKNLFIHVNFIVTNRFENAN
jgi:hypothetical protein